MHGRWSVVASYVIHKHRLKSPPSSLLPRVAITEEEPAGLVEETGSDRNRWGGQIRVHYRGTLMAD